MSRGARITLFPWDFLVIPKQAILSALSETLNPADLAKH
jgi:hypothetical protein